MPADIVPLKEIQKFIWSQGDYEQLAQEGMPAAEALVAACGVGTGQQVLDVGAGNGNVAVAAARLGASVVACDLTPAMLELGRSRSAAEGLDIEWLEADAEALPFDVGRFDCVSSCFAAMFAPRPDVAAGEMFRVARRGGTVGMANWTPEGYIGRFHGHLTARLPPSPENVPSPLHWGIEDVVRSRLEQLAAKLGVERHAVRMAHASVDEMWAFLEHNNGPLVAARMALGDNYGPLAADGKRLIEKSNTASDDSVVIDAEYLLVVARKPGS